MHNADKHAAVPLKLRYPFVSFRYARSIMSGASGGQSMHPVAQHLDDCGGDVGRPHGDNAVRVTQLHDAVPGVLPHCVACAHLCPVLRYDLPGAHVLYVPNRVPVRKKQRPSLEHQKIDWNCHNLRTLGLLDYIPHLISEDASLSYGGQQEVVGEEIQAPDSCMLLQHSNAVGND
jgi:hypothetical protein